MASTPASDVQEGDLLVALTSYTPSEHKRAEGFLTLTTGQKVSAIFRERAGVWLVRCEANGTEKNGYVYTKYFVRQPAESATSTRLSAASLSSRPATSASPHQTTDLAAKSNGSAISKARKAFFDFWGRKQSSAETPSAVSNAAAASPCPVPPKPPKPTLNDLRERQAADRRQPPSPAAMAVRTTVGSSVMPGPTATASRPVASASAPVATPTASSSGRLSTQQLHKTAAPAASAPRGASSASRSSSSSNIAPANRANGHPPPGRSSQTQTGSRTTARSAAHTTALLQSSQPSPRKYAAPAAAAAAAAAAAPAPASNNSSAAVAASHTPSSRAAGELLHRRPHFSQLAKVRDVSSKTATLCLLKTNSTFKMPLSKVASGGLDLVSDDVVSVLFGKTAKRADNRKSPSGDRPSNAAERAFLERCNTAKSSRSPAVWCKYLSSCSNIAEAAAKQADFSAEMKLYELAECPTPILEICHNDSLFRDPDILSGLLRLLALLAKGKRARINSLVRTVIDTPLFKRPPAIVFQTLADNPGHHGHRAIQAIIESLAAIKMHAKDGAKCAPMLQCATRLYVKLQSAILAVAPSPANALARIRSPSPADLQRSAKDLCSLLELLAGALVAEAGGATQRQQASLVLSEEERIAACRQHPKSTLHLLPKLPAEGGFASVEEHLDALFALYHADTLWALREGMHSLFSSTLDQRDMAVMVDVRLTECYVPDASISDASLLMLLELRPLLPPKSPDKSGLLAFGNLLCIVPSRSEHEAAVWATVVERVKTPSSRSGKPWTVLVALCDHLGGPNITTAVQSLLSANGQAVALQSPAYFQAHAPVLRRLQSMTPEDVPFPHILSLLDSKMLPDNGDELAPWLQADGQASITVSCQHVFPVTDLMHSFDHEAERLLLQELLQRLPSSTLDNHQQKAVRHSFSAPVSIIQGVPGGGKSFIGVAIAKLLGTMQHDGSSERLLKRPIVVITYKNHALDEFLLDCDKFWPGEVVRFGGRAGPSVEHMLMNKVLDKSHLSKSDGGDVSSRLASIRQEMSKTYDELKAALDAFSKAQMFNWYAFCQAADPTQVIDFVVCVLSAIEELGSGKHSAAEDDSGGAAAAAAGDGSKKKNKKKNKKNRQGQSMSAEASVQMRAAHGDSMLQNFITDSAIKLKQSGLELLSKLREDSLSHKAKLNLIRNAVDKQLSSHKEGPLQAAFALWKKPAEKIFGDKTRANSTTSGSLSKFVTSLLQQRGGTWAAATNESGGSGGNSAASTEEEDQDADDEEQRRLEEDERRAAAEMKRGSVLDQLKRQSKGDAGTKFERRPWNPTIAHTDDLVELGLKHWSSLWAMKDPHLRAQYMIHLTGMRFESERRKLEEAAEQYQQHLKAQVELRSLERAELVLRKAKVVGFTVTGACIHNTVLQHLRPEVIIFEEAAEITEPQLLACLHGGLKHLILIGDHQQLPPKVEAYPLDCEKNLAISLMKRLVDNEMPFETLWKQNRMTPMLSCYLHDIYPRLENNLARVEDIKIPGSLGKLGFPIFWWAHRERETKDRGYTNASESQRITYLVLLLVFQGVDPSTITVLSGYKGQTRRLRQDIKSAVGQLNADMQALLWEPVVVDGGDDPAASSSGKSAAAAAKTSSKAAAAPTPGARDGASKRLKVQIETVDQYQGDENDIIVLSMVRSNDNRNTGFMGIINRRCVAISRARRGLYIVGNDEVFRGSSVWKEMLKELDKDGLVSSQLPLRCERHPIETEREVQDEKDLRNCYQQLCNKLCMRPLECCEEQPPHPCPRRCHGGQCLTRCGAEISWYCQTSPNHHETIRCYEKLEHECGHPCEHELACQHKCRNKCSEPCIEAKECEEPVTYECIEGHRTPNIKCRALPQYKCACRCTKVLACSHPCPQTCSEPCLEPSKCNRKVPVRCAKSDHESVVKCNEQSNFMCDAPCAQILECGHPCPLDCYETCLPSSMVCNLCIVCKERDVARARELEIENRDAMIKQLENEMRRMSDDRDFVIVELDPIGNPDDLSDYNRVKDHFERSIQESHGRALVVEKVSKIVNKPLMEQHLKAINDALGCGPVRQLFHGTTREKAEAIAEIGFKLPERKTGNMFGQGVYFASASSKSAQDIYTEGSGTVLYCDVQLGKMHSIRGLTSGHGLRDLLKYSEEGHPYLDATLDSMRQAGFDSVYGVRDSKDDNGVLFDEYTVYDPYLALPRFIITFSESFLAHLKPLKRDVFDIVPIERNQFLRDDDDDLDFHFRMAESQVLRMLKHSASVTKVEVIVNPKLQKAFDARLKHFKKCKTDPGMILAFHGSTAQAYGSIAENNFDIGKLAKGTGCKGLYGAGIYFSEVPEKAQTYAHEPGRLLLSRVLVGKAYKCPYQMLGAPKQPGYDSHVVHRRSGNLQDPDPELLEIVIFNTDQILPQYIVSFEKK